MASVIVCDDQEIIREGLKNILENHDDINIIATAENGEDLLRNIEEYGIPDLILMDLKMPRMNGIQATHRVRSLYPKTKILILTTYDDDQWIMDAIRAGATGYLLKDTPRLDLVDAVRGTLRGQNFIDPSIAGRILGMVTGSLARPSTKDAPPIQPREKQILTLIARGLSNSEIAGEIFLSEGTVRNYASAIFVKLGVSDRTQAVITALRYGILKLDEI